MSGRAAVDRVLVRERMDELAKRRNAVIANCPWRASPGRPSYWC